MKYYSYSNMWGFFSTRGGPDRACFRTYSRSFYLAVRTAVRTAVRIRRQEGQCHDLSTAGCWAPGLPSSHCGPHVHHIFTSLMDMATRFENPTSKGKQAVSASQGTSSGPNKEEVQLPAAGRMHKVLDLFLRSDLLTFLPSLVSSVTNKDIWLVFVIGITKRVAHRDKTLGYVTIKDATAMTTDSIRVPLLHQCASIVTNQDIRF